MWMGPVKKKQAAYFESLLPSRLKAGRLVCEEIDQALFKTGTLLLHSSKATLQPARLGYE